MEKAQQVTHFCVVVAIVLHEDCCHYYFLTFHRPAVRANVKHRGKARPLQAI